MLTGTQSGFSESGKRKPNTFACSRKGEHLTLREGTSKPYSGTLNPMGFRFHKPFNSLRQQVTHVKDRTDELKTCGVVYNIYCEQCQKSYIGETSRTLCTRVKGRQSHEMSSLSNTIEQIRPVNGLTRLVRLVQVVKQWFRGCTGCGSMVICISLKSLSNDMQFTNCTTRKPLFHDPYESYGSWTCIYTPSPSNDVQFTNCTTRKPLFHDPYDS